MERRSFYEKIRSSDNDHGARLYSPDLRRWMVPDPLSEKYYGISPYCYCADNPLNLVDLDGKNPINNEFGKFLGTDDEGLKGEAYVLHMSDFIPGMSHSDAVDLNIGMGSLSEDIQSHINQHFKALPSRPDWDGCLTIAEANEWYRKGNGQPLFIPLKNIFIKSSFMEEIQVGRKTTINLFRQGELKDALVFGQISVMRHPGDYIKAYYDTYNFDMKPWNDTSQWLRNIGTIIGKGVAGSGI